VPYRVLLCCVRSGAGANCYPARSGTHTAVRDVYRLGLLQMATLKRSDQFRERVKIYATDLDEEALQQARAGIYETRTLADVPERGFAMSTSSPPGQGRSATLLNHADRGALAVRPGTGGCYKPAQEPQLALRIMVQRPLLGIGVSRFYRVEAIVPDMPYGAVPGGVPGGASLKGGAHRSCY
jgi:hypothetical protein